MAEHVAAGLTIGMLSAGCPLLKPRTVMGCRSGGDARLPDVVDIGDKPDARLNSAVSDVHGSSNLGGCKPFDVASHGSCDLRAMRVGGSLLCWLSQCSGPLAVTWVTPHL